jgi:hypothetical protein
MLRRAAPAAAALGCRALATSPYSSSAVNSILLRSLKEHYLELSKMRPPPKMSPPKPFTIVKGALDEPSGAVLRREYGEAGEEISISVARLANILPSEAEADSDSDGAVGMSLSIGQLFLHVDISKPGSGKSLQFLCGLYPDAVGIHSVCLRSKNAGSLDGDVASKGGGAYRGRIFQ